MISRFDERSFVLTVDIGKVLRLHNEPDSFDRIEVGRVGRKIDRLEEMPIETLPFMP